MYTRNISIGFGPMDEFGNHTEQLELGVMGLATCGACAAVAWKKGPGFQRKLVAWFLDSARGPRSPYAEFVCDALSVADKDGAEVPPRSANYEAFLDASCAQSGVSPDWVADKVGDKVGQLQRDAERRDAWNKYIRRPEEPTVYNLVPLLRWHEEIVRLLTTPVVVTEAKPAPAPELGEGKKEIIFRRTRPTEAPMPAVEADDGVVL